MAGLTHEEAARRAAAGQGNRAHTPRCKSVRSILRENLCTVFNLVNFLLAAAVLSVGSYKNALFLGVVFSNLAIGIIQELRARQAVLRLELRAVSPVRTLRSGEEVSLAPEELVLGDAVHLRAGERVPADARILEGFCEADTAALTGEGEPRGFAPGDVLDAGFILTSGSVLAGLTAVGDDCRIAQIAASARTHKPAKSEIMVTLERLVSVMGILILPLGALLLWRQTRLSPWPEAIVSTAASLIAMIPEGLMLLTSSVLAVAVVRLSAKQVLVRELASIESLARVDTLCLDKTGTLTEGDMDVRCILPLGDRSGGELRAVLSRLTGVLDECSPTWQALCRACPPDRTAKADELLPFSSERKRSGARFGETVWVLGAPRRLCPGNPRVEEVLCAHEPSWRWLLLGRADAPDAPFVRPEALIALTDRVRPSAPGTMEYFTRQGVRLLVISGDDPDTVSAIAAGAGVPHASSRIDASLLDTPEKLRAACERYTVFGRVTPEQKRALVEALQQAGHTVAMTGDGVNDVPALRSADCGIAMASGTEAARAVAKLVLVGSDFDALPSVVAEGRRSVNNLQRSASLFLVKTMYAAALAVLFAVLPWEYPFIPVQMTLCSVATIGTPSFLLALEPNRERIRGRFLDAVLRHALPSALSVVVMIPAAELLARGLGLPEQELATACVGILGAAGLSQVRRVCVPRTPWRAAVFCGMCAIFALGYLPLSSFFELTPPLSRTLLCPVTFVLTAAFAEALARAFRRSRPEGPA